MNSVDPTVSDLWHPIAASDDLPHRHTYHAALEGRELVAWRADDDHVNVWENRCLHRGLRLSVGINDGAQLRCRYHGWRYANRTGGCTYIPAHPADAPARTITTHTYPSTEKYGLVWTSLRGDGAPPTVGRLDSDELLVFRGVEVWAAAATTTHHLSSVELPGPHDAGILATTGPAELLDDRCVAIPIEVGGVRGHTVHFVQPVADDRCVIRGVLDHLPDTADVVATLRAHNRFLSSFRDRLESVAGSGPPPGAGAVRGEPVRIRPTGGTDVGSGRAPTTQVRVARRWPTGEGIVGIELEPVSEPLPTVQPGAHVDLHLPNGLVRQYSLVNGPGETRSYTIGVKLEPDSRGGSRYIHDEMRTGDEVGLSGPRNGFPLRRDALRSVLVAGGIGLTPLLSMARALHHEDMPFELHCFARSRDHVPFPELLDSLGQSVRLHLGASPEKTSALVTELLEGHRDAHHLYLCGPPAMLDAARHTAGELGWPDSAVHFEYFANTTTIDDSSSFDVHLARSALTVRVEAGQSVLAALRDQGIDLASSCEQGACGTCAVTVLDGDVTHNDVYLSGEEKRRGDTMMTCVSRARSDRLVLDI